MSAVLQYPQRHQITTEEYLRMGEAGVFAPEARLELIEGEIVEMAPIGSPHASVVNTLAYLFFTLAGNRAIVSVQAPTVAGERSVPQPDLMLLKPRADRYFSAHPGPDDVLLLVEVSDSTLAFDVGTKLPLYARAGITEVWIVDVNARAVQVHREPGASGYGRSFTAPHGESIAVLALPEARLAVSEIFPASHS